MQGLWNRSWWGILVLLDPHDRAYVVHTLPKGFIRWSFCERVFRAKNLQWNQNATKLANQSWYSVKQAVVHVQRKRCPRSMASILWHDKSWPYKLVYHYPRGLGLLISPRVLRMWCSTPTTDSCIGPCDHDLNSEMMYGWYGPFWVSFRCWFPPMVDLSLQLLSHFPVEMIFPSRPNRVKYHAWKVVWIVRFSPSSLNTYRIRNSVQGLLRSTLSKRIYREQ